MCPIVTDMSLGHMSEASSLCWQEPEFPSSSNLYLCHCASPPRWVYLSVCQWTLCLFPLWGFIYFEGEVQREFFLSAATDVN